jgi:hypothetical protein
VEGALVGAGDTLTTWGRNVRELKAELTGNEGALAKIAADREEADSIRARLQAEAPIASRVGGALPALATLPIGMGVGGAGMLAGRAGQIATGIGTGAVTGALGSESGDMGEGAAIGGALSGIGSMAGQMVSRVTKGIAARSAARGGGPMAGGGLNAAEAGIVEGAQRAGMKVLPGQASGSPVARQWEAGLASHPLTSKAFQEIEQANRQQLNSLAAKAMGVEADNVGAEVRTLAANQIAQQFDDIGRKIGTVETKPLQAALQNIADEEATAVLPAAGIKSIMRQFSEGAAGRQVAAGGVADEVTGAALMKGRSQAAKKMRDAFANNRSEEGDVYARVVDAFDDVITRAAKANVGEDIAGAYDKTRAQWSVLRAMDRGGAALDGNVQVGNAARIMSQSDKGGFARAATEGAGGRPLQQGTGTLGENALGDFYDALRFRASPIGRPIVGDSGTATRSAVGQWLQGGSTLGTVANVAGNQARRMAVNPVMRAYSRMSPESARLNAATIQTIREAQGDAATTAAGGGIGRLFTGD